MTYDGDKDAVISETKQQQKDLMDLVRGNGPWQWSILAVVILTNFPDGSNNMSMSFIAPNVDHWCARPPDSNMSVQEWKMIALPPDDMQCSRYKFINTTLLSNDHFNNKSASRELIPCDSWEYDNSTYTSTIVCQWDLVCDRAWLVSMSKSIFIAGVFLSSTLFAYLSDKLGRKPVIVICNALAIVCGVFTIFSTSFLMFAISRLFVAAGVSGADHAASVLMVETVSPKYRPPYYVALFQGWLAGVLCLPLIAWWLRDWVRMEAVIIMPSVLLLSSWWLLPESPRWLLAHGKTDEALKILSKAAKRNGLKISYLELREMVKELKEGDDDEKPKTNVLQLFKSELRLRTLVMWFLWCATAFVYYGISYNTNELAGDPFINFTIYALMEIPSSLVALTAMQYQGRRRPLAVSLTCAGVACLLTYPIPEDFVWMRISLSLFAKFCISATFNILGLFTNEVFPTVLRITGYGSASAVARLAAVMAPFVRELGRANHPVIPQILFGVLSITGGALALLLPETKNCSVPDTVREATEMSGSSTCKKRVENAWILKDFVNGTETESLLTS